MQERVFSLFNGGPTVHLRQFKGRWYLAFDEQKVSEVAAMLMLRTVYPKALSHGYHWLQTGLTYGDFLGLLVTEDGSTS